MHATATAGWSSRARGFMHDAPGGVQVAVFLLAATLPVYLGFLVAHALPHIGGFRSSNLVGWITVALFPVPWFIINLILDTIMDTVSPGSRHDPHRPIGRLMAREALTTAVLVLLALVVLRSAWGCVVAAIIAQALHHLAEPFLDLDD